MAEQAYSTPVPLAYVASRLAGIDGSKTVLEPSAGNGALLMEAKPSNASANELNEVRATNLADQGFRVRRDDAAKPQGLKGDPVDVVIANPPFGAVRDRGASTVFEVADHRTTAIDHAISLSALQRMKDNGRAVLIVGSVKDGSRETRSDSYNSSQKRKFYKRLYDTYNVVDHFTVSGDLYQKQGAGWPVDVIVIGGKGKSALQLPAVRVPEVLNSWEALKGKLDASGSGDVSDRGGEEVRRPVGGEPRSESGDRRRGEAPGKRGPVVSQRDRSELDAAPSGLQADRDEPRAAGRDGLGDDQRNGVLEGGRDLLGTDHRVAAQERQPRLKSDPHAAGQVPYRPYSREGKPLDTLVPAALGASMDESLGAIEREHGDIDHYVARELGYELSELKDVFSAEQIDAIALAINNVKNGDAFIIGDQTGIGKGRVVAGAIRYAHKLGQVPLFITEKPDLYGDMYRDLADIKWAKSLGREPRNLHDKFGPLDSARR